MRPNEIASVCYVRFGRRPDYRTVERVLAEEPMPLRMVRRFPPYRETGEPRERRTAVVRLHAEGRNAKSIASYLETTRPTVYRALKRWIEEGIEGLDDRPNSGGGVRKADLKAYATVRRLQENPELGAFRAHAALARLGIHLSPRTAGRILAVNRRLYGQTDSVIPLAMRAPPVAENRRRGPPPALAADPRAWHSSGSRRCRRGARSGRGFAKAGGRPTPP